jgi:hypothetical protein
VRGVALSILTLLASCAPDYGHSAFRCDADHGCPAGQACVVGRCRTGLPAGDGVVCATVTCDATQQCCLDLFNPPRCIAAGDVCPGTSALCDGVEDCPAGERCCATGSTVACGASCDEVVCREAADCPSTAPNCCASDQTPWGTCSALGC